MAGKTSVQNGKKGGRPKGKKTPATLEKEAVLKQFRLKTMQSADVLFNSQLHLATGQTFLYKIEKELRVGPKGGKSYINSKPKIVTNEEEILMYLQGLVEEGDMNDSSDPEATYYFITTEKPDRSSIDSLLDRTFGKSVQPVAGDPENPLVLQITGMNIVKESTKDK